MKLGHLNCTQRISPTTRSLIKLALRGLCSQKRTSKTHGFLKFNSKRRTYVGPISKERTSTEQILARRTCVGRISKERTSGMLILGAQTLGVRTLLRHTFLG